MIIQIEQERKEEKKNVSKNIVMNSNYFSAICRKEITEIQMFMFWLGYQNKMYIDIAIRMTNCVENFHVHISTQIIIE